MPGDITTAHGKPLPGGTQLVNFSRVLPFGGFHVYVQVRVVLVWSVKVVWEGSSVGV